MDLTDEERALLALGDLGGPASGDDDEEGAAAGSADELFDLDALRAAGED